MAKCSILERAEAIYISLFLYALFLAPSKIVLIAELMNICLLPASPNGLL
jgi:hypothetical protein